MKTNTLQLKMYMLYNMHMHKDRDRQTDRHACVHAWCTCAA